MKLIKLSLFFVFFLSCKTEKDIIPPEYNIFQQELKVYDIEERNGYFLFKAINSGKDTLKLISYRKDPYVSVNRKKRERLELEKSKLYEFDYIRLFPRGRGNGSFGFTHIIVKNDTLWSGNIKTNNEEAPHFYRILDLYKQK